jgi:transcriptional regulator with GAF, ATPase, and Fis domain
VPEPLLDEGAETQLRAYDFPGNVRELQNVIERAVVLAPTAGGRLRFELGRAAAAPSEAGTPAVPVLSVNALRELERRNLQQALEQCGYQIAGKHGAAQVLGMSPSTLTYHMRRLGIRRMRETKAK